jgi:ferrochelatase
MNTYDAVLFIGFGGPEKSEDIMPFLEIVTKGRGIPRERLLDVAHHYESMGGASPINEITRRQAHGLEAELKARGLGLKVYIGQRNWHPFLEDTLRQMASDGVKRAIGFPAAAHRCEASLERYINAVEEARQKVTAGAPQIDFVGPWFDHPRFIDAIAERVKESFGANGPGNGKTWFFTAHSIPCTMAKESTYVQELRRTAQLVADRFGKKDWALAYSSRSGNPREPWLEPDVCDAIREKAKSGVKEIALIPIGFIADHVEILFDLDVEAKAAAKEAGVQLMRSASVGDHALFVKMMADVIQNRMKSSEIPEQRASGSTVYQDGHRESKAGKNSSTCYCQPDTKDPACCRWAAMPATGRPVRA